MNWKYIVLNSLVVTLGVCIPFYVFDKLSSEVVGGVFGVSLVAGIFMSCIFNIGDKKRVE